MKKRFLSAIVIVLSLFLVSNCAMADTITGIPAPGTNYGAGYVGGGFNYGVTDRIPVYCFYSAFKRDYFWTAFEDEMNQLLVRFNSGTDDYQYQGISGYAEQNPSEHNVPVYRFWNNKTLDHFYTISETEKDQLQKDYNSGKDNYAFEGIAWYVPQTSNIPVYRFFDVSNYNHFYISDEQVKESLNQAYLDGTGSYRYEGIAWYWLP